jgi:hypothetical protein
MAQFSDGATIPVGSLVLTIDSVTYIFEDLTINKTSNRIEELDEDGDPARAVIYTETPTMSGTAQYATTTTAEIEIGDTATIASGTAAGTWIVTSVSPTIGSRAFKKASVNFVKKINV